MDLVECLTDSHPTALELDMHQREAIDEDRHIIAVRTAPPLLHLIDDLQAVATGALPIEEADILHMTIVEAEVMAVSHVHLTRLLREAITRAIQILEAETLPLGISELHPIEVLELEAHVPQQRLGVLDMLGILIALTAEVFDELALQRCLTLVALCRLRLGLILIEDDVARRLGNRGSLLHRLGSLCSVV